MLCSQVFAFTTKYDTTIKKFFSKKKNNNNEKPNAICKTSTKGQHFMKTVLLENEEIVIYFKFQFLYFAL